MWCSARICNVCTHTYLLRVSTQHLIVAILNRKGNACFHIRAIRGISSAVTGVRFASNDLFCVILRDRWCDITHIILNLHPISDDMMCCRIHSMYNQSIYSMKSLSTTSKFCSLDFNTKVKTYCIVSLAVGNERSC
jgi:hypothetical protein